MMPLEVTGPVQEMILFWLKRWLGWRHPGVEAIGADQLERILAGAEGDDWLILDARRSDEFECSHLPGSTLIKAPDLNPATGSIAALGKDTPILVVCSVGVRSAERVEDLRQLGFTKAVHLEGGLFQWVREGHSLQRQGQPTQQVHRFNRFWGMLLGPTGR